MELAADGHGRSVSCDISQWLQEKEKVKKYKAKCLQPFHPFRVWFLPDQESML